MEEKFIKDITAAPAVVLDATVDTSRQIFETVTHQKHVKKASDFWKMLGPGLTTGGCRRRSIRNHNILSSRSSIRFSITLAIAIYFPFYISSSKKIMGNRANSPAISLLGWIITGVMIVSGVATIASLLL